MTANQWLLRPAKVSVKDAVTRFLNRKHNENLAASTIEKLKTISKNSFFLGYCVAIEPP